MRLGLFALSSASLGFLFLGPLAGASRAADLILDHLPAGAIKLDGKVGKEWPGATPASESVKAGKATATIMAGYDAKGIWIGAEVVKDGGIARTSAFGANEDCVGLVVGFPKEGVAKGGSAPDVVHEVGLYAGVPGSSAGVVKFRGGPNAGKTVEHAEIIEAKRAGGGYTLEAFIPWSAFPEAKRIRAGLRGVVRVYDGDGSTLRAIKATGPGSVESPGSLPYLLTESEQSIPQALAARKMTWKDIAYDVSADVAGDGMNERVIFVGRQLFVLGPTYKEGKQWLLFDLGADPMAVETREATGDGKADFLVTTRVKAASTTRDALSVWTFMGPKGAETPTRVFTHETRVASGSDVLEDKLTFAGGKKPSISIGFEKPKGYTVDTYKEPIATDIDPILWPWGAVKERTFVWNGSSFVKDKEVPQKASTPSVSAGGSGGGSGPSETKPSSPALAPATDLVNGAIKAFKKEKGLGDDVAPRIELDVTVVPGKKGRAALYGKDLVVATGDGGYAVLSMSRFTNEKDIIDIQAKDLTGDGRDDLIVRGMLRAKLTSSGPGGKEQDVLREVMLFYAPKVDKPPKANAPTMMALVPVFGVETSRAMGKDHLDVNFRIITAKGSTPGKIELMKGTAKGFGKTNWPFGTETPSQGIEPLLLPWGTESSVVYTWNGERFTR